MKEECKVSCVKRFLWSIVVQEVTNILIFIFSNIVLNMVLNVVLNLVLNSILLVFFVTTILKILTGKNSVIFNSVEEFIEIRVWLLLNFPLCLHNQLSYKNSIVAY